jgi:hypothetical protein
MIESWKVEVFVLFVVRAEWEDAHALGVWGVAHFPKGG